MSDTPLHPHVRDAAAAYHRPDETPREEMWERIRTARRPRGLGRATRPPRRGEAAVRPAGRTVPDGGHVPGGDPGAASPAMNGADRRAADRAAEFTAVPGVALPAVGPHLNGRAPAARGNPVSRGLLLDLARWTGAAAAALVLTLGMVRFTGWLNERPGTGYDEVTYGSWAVGGGVPFPATLLAHPAAIEHLDRAGMLIAMFREDAAAGRWHPDVAAWAIELLAEARILLDSPAAADPEVTRLLADLELVLAQIAHLAVDAAEAEVRLALDGIEAADMLARLRSAMPDEWLAAGL